MQITTTTEVDSQMIDNLIVSAIEGGSGYWCESVRLKDAAMTSVKPWYSDPKLYEMPDFQIRVSEIEASTTGASRIHMVGPEQIRAALQKMADEYPTHFGDIIQDETDADTGDTLLQLAALGEIVYG